MPLKVVYLVIDEFVALLHDCPELTGQILLVHIDLVLFVQQLILDQLDQLILFASIWKLLALVIDLGSQILDLLVDVASPVPVPKILLASACP